MTGQTCNVTISPSQEKGIRFYAPGSSTPVLANYKSVVSTDNCVTLANSQGAKVVLVEHFMAACAFAGIDSLDVSIDFPEFPILDGSALEWYKLFLEAGTDENRQTDQVSFNKPLGITNGKADLMLIPAAKPQFTYCINFDHPELKNRWVSFDLSLDKNRVIEARTFGYLKDLEKFRQAGMALGVTIDNTVGLTEEGYTTELRSGLEPAKHKILDLIGDLYLTGLNPLGFNAHIIAKDAGHKIHVEFARLIAEELRDSLNFAGSL